MSHKFTQMSDANLAAHIARLDRLTDTSDSIDEYARLMHNLDRARDEQRRRQESNQPATRA